MFNFIKEAMSPTTRSKSSQKSELTETTTTTKQKDDNNEQEEHCVKESSCSIQPTMVALKPIKGYKITDNERSRKFGVGANSLEMLKTKAKLKFPIKDLHIYLASDGYEVTDEDYFSTLESQTLFIVAGPDAIITTDSDFEFEQLRQRSPLLKVADIIYDFMEQQPEKFSKLIAEYERKKLPQQKYDQNKTVMSIKTEHPEWFLGQEEKCHTKEEALQRRAQDRVRCYYYKTKDELTRNRLYQQNQKARQIIDSVLEKFRYLLIGCDYFSMIFNRKCEHKHEIIKQKLDEEKDDETDARAVIPNKKLKQVIKEYTARHEILDQWSVSLCTDLGDFYCQGSYSDASNNCSLQHTINPYASRENLILFQVWNLDHQIELSRTILPALIENVRQLISTPKPQCSIHKTPAIDVSVLEYFLEIFSLKNLKLVHIVCHEKSQRQNKSNGRLLCKQCHEYKIVEELMQVDYDYNPDEW
ncbi:DNA fragmentation factor subunit beta [Musca vetustissima]|uniref:DNA fragmentation factor subunit beta n=1 Tax=Musca vetustissima TaxID=27455 RepID=UPI002AB640C8|nr:DNA fragmentation factor subunit beta [Musca vetustissima]